MTNILFSIVCALTTNVTEIPTGRPVRAVPCPDGMLGCAVFHGEPYGDSTGKIVITIVARITNAVARLGAESRIIEIGREPLFTRTETFDRVVETRWILRSATTNAPASATNAIRSGTNLIQLLR